MKKGFTLIELLAVIVILAIIALIATPIILGIINDAKEDSNKRSIENYAHAVELAVARFATGNGGMIYDGTYTIDPDNKQIIYDQDPSIKIPVDYKGEKITGTVEVDAKGKIKLIEVQLSDSEKKYNYSEDTGVEEVKEKEISEEKDIAITWYMYSSMYDETQIEIIDGILVDDLNNDKKSDINSELSAYFYGVGFNIPVSDFTEAVPTSGNIKALITHYDGSKEEIILTTTDNKVWEYTYNFPFKNNDHEETMKFMPNTKYDEDAYENFDYHMLELGAFWIPFSKLTILGKTIEFPVNKQVHIMAGNIETETAESLYKDIDKVSRVIVNLKNGEKKEYKRNQMYDANKYIGENEDYYSSPINVPVLYMEAQPGINLFIINTPYIDIDEPIDSIIVEEDGVLIKYNITDKTYVMHQFMGS